MVTRSLIVRVVFAVAVLVVGQAALPVAWAQGLTDVVGKVGGAWLPCRLVSATANDITVNTAQGVQTFPRDQVTALLLGSGPYSPPPATHPATASVWLLSAGGAKLQVVKVVKTLTGLGLKESKDLVDAAPSCIKANVSYEEALAIKLQLVDVGAQVELR